MKSTTCPISVAFNRLLIRARALSVRLTDGRR